MALWIPKKWKREGEELIGDTELGTHTHIGPGFVSIKVESTGEHPIVWKTDLQPPCRRCHKPHDPLGPCY